jgi:hypothetical protein
MKKTLTLLALFASTSIATEVTYFGGFKVFPLEIRGLENVAVSDYQQFGVNDSLGGSEGRINLNLSDANFKGNKGGLEVGALIHWNRWVGTQFAVQFGSTEQATMFRLNLSPQFQIYRSKHFDFNLTSALNLQYLTIDFPDSELVKDYTNPVILDDITFSNGDNINAEISGAGYSVGGKAILRFTKEWGVYGSASYEYGKLTGLKIMNTSDSTSDAELDLNDPAIIEQTLYEANPISFKPEVATHGFSWSAGISFTWGGSSSRSKEKVMENPPLIENNIGDTPKKVQETAPNQPVEIPTQNPIPVPASINEASTEPEEPKAEEPKVEEPKEAPASLNSAPASGSLN